MSIPTLALALALFQIKHFLADYQWQMPWMIAGKQVYGAAGGIAHAGLHALLSLPILLLAGANPGWALLIALVEFLVHYHIDWGKVRVTSGRDLSIDDHAYWQAFGLDQLAHQLTYVAMLCAAIALP